MDKEPSSKALLKNLMKTEGMTVIEQVRSIIKRIESHENRLHHTVDMIESAQKNLENEQSPPSTDHCRLKP